MGSHGSEPAPSPVPFVPLLAVRQGEFGDARTHPAVVDARLEALAEGVPSTPLPQPAFEEQLRCSCRLALELRLSGA